MRNVAHYKSPGFSLIELMIGMVMGMIVILVISQTLAVSEGYKRTTTSGSDAQNNGLMALRALQSEIRMAGYGFMNKADLCPSIKAYNQNVSANNGVVTMNNMPVKIVDGGTGLSDTIEVTYSSSTTGAMPTHITQNMPTPSNATKVNTVAGMKTCDMVMYAAPDGSKQCTVLQVTGFNNNNPQFLTGSGQSNYNPSGGGNVGLFPYLGYTTSDIVINMGGYVDRRYQVNNTQVSGSATQEYFLTRVNLMSGQMASGSNCTGTDPNPNLNLVSNIVNIQAQYGVAATNSQQVTCWVDATNSNPSCTDTTLNSIDWSAPGASDIKKIKAIRVAVVARSSLSEKPSSGTNCDTTTTPPVSWNGGPAIDLSANTSWKCYRYKVYQTIVPMMNVVWANL